MKLPGKLLLGVRTEQNPLSLVSAAPPRSFLRIAGISLLVLPFFTAAMAVEAKLTNFNLPAGMLAETLKQFAAQASREIVFAPDAIGAVPTKAVSGRFTPREALDLMLAGTGLVVSQDAKTGAFAVRKAAPNPSESGPKQNNPPAAPERRSGGDETEVVRLSPFVVSSGSEQGYHATETLSGTRIRSEVRDLGSAMTIFTEQMLDDLGAHNVNDILKFSPNTDPFLISTDQTTNFGATFILTPTQYVTRGGSTTLITQDFFQNDIPQDRYNSEALTFTRGPNSILFGQGEPAGGFTSATKRAKDKTATAITVEGDEYDSLRATLDHNQVLKKNVLAMRYAGLHERGHTFRIPSEKRQQRNFLTLRLKLPTKTEVRASYEMGELRLPAIKPWATYDAISPWYDAGKPLQPVHVNTAAGKPRGLVNYGNTALVSTDFSPGGTRIPIQYLTNQAQTAPATYANGYPDWFTKRTFNDNRVYPVLATVDGGSYRNAEYRIQSVAVEQEITPHFFLEAAAQEIDQDVRAVYGFVADLGFLYADPNAQLPNGAPNPNVGKLYTESRAFMFVSPKLSQAWRVVSSYDLDLVRNPNWTRHLGRQRLVAFAEGRDTRSSNATLGTFNLTPLVTTGAAGVITNVRNRIDYRYYYDPAQGRVGNPGGQQAAYPTLLYANGPIPARDPSGITIGYAHNQGGNASESVVRTEGAALQSFFLKNRLVLTHGIRRDTSRVWSATAQDMTARADANGIRPDPASFDLRKDFASSRAAASGRTYTQGAVLHVRPWLSLTYNRSDNFLPNLGSRNIYGEILPNPQGKGSDYGLRLALLENRLLLNVTWYTLKNLNQFDPINANPAGSFVENSYIWDAIAAYTNNPVYASIPYSQTGFGWYDTASNTSKGVEFTITANPSKQWRISLNGSQRGNNTTTARGETVAQYLEEYLPKVEARPDWMALTAANVLVSQRVANLRRTMENFQAIKNVPASVYAPKWTLNMVVSHDFAPAGLLNGVTVGASMNARGAAIAGFKEHSDRPGNLLNPEAPYEAPSYAIYGAWLGYRMKAFKDKVDWRWQLNVRNLFNEDAMYPMRIVDSRDGRHTPSVAIYALREPQAFSLSTTIRF